MHRILYDTLNNLNEGLIITDKNLEIYYWNHYMEQITNIEMNTAMTKNILEILPGLNKSYLKKSIKGIICNDCKVFLSSAMHQDLIENRRGLNLKISKIARDHHEFLLFEFINVAVQTERINQLKNWVNELSSLNQDLKDKEKVIKKLAYYDNLTGVANRALFYKFADKFIESAKRNHNLLGLIFLDINRFKNINDRYGHQAGDKVLRKVAETLIRSTRKSDVVARFGGDEFLILLPYLKSFDDYHAIITRIMNNKVNNFIVHEEQIIKISFSIGVSFYPEDGNSIDELIKKADEAMYLAKNTDGEDFCYYKYI